MHYENLLEYANIHGHCNIPQSSPKKSINRLAQWANKQRELHFSGRLSAARERLLEKANFSFRIRGR
jgi:hypothetical protein